MDVWVELDADAATALWTDFVERFGFRAGITPAAWPAIDEPVPSITWDLSPIFAGSRPGGFAGGMRRVAELVLGTLQDCTEWHESVVFHDWVHPSALLRPHLADAVDDVPRWDVGSLFPNGDYMIFLGHGYRFGLLGHPWEQSLCVFGDVALGAIGRRDSGILGPVIRRDGQPGERPFLKK